MNQQTILAWNNKPGIISPSDNNHPIEFNSKFFTAALFRSAFAYNRFMKLHADLSKPDSCNIKQPHWKTLPSAGVNGLRFKCDNEQPPVEPITSIIRFAPQKNLAGI